MERILSTCLDRIVSGEWTVSDCLEQYPQEAAGMRELLTLASALQRTRRQIEPRRTFRLGGTARLLERLESSARPPAATKVSLWDKVEQSLAGIMGGRRFAFAGAAMALLLAVLTLGGLVNVADAAAPGDALYSVDLAVESARVRLTSDPAQMASLRMDFAEERLDEAERLTREGDAENFEMAVFGYGTEVAAVTAAIHEGAVSDSSMLSTVNQTMAEQEVRLNAIFATATGADEGETAAGVVCADDSAGFAHPLAASLASQYELETEDVVGLFCDGYSFGEVLLALATVQETEFSLELILAVKSDVRGWGRVWQTVDEGFPGPPEDVGPPVEPPGQQDEPPGPPVEPPGQQDEPPGPPVEPPGQQDGPPGQQDGPPGQQDGPPGQQDGPPGQQDGPPGQQDGPPGQQDEPPGDGRPDNPPGGGRP